MLKVYSQNCEAVLKKKKKTIMNIAKGTRKDCSLKLHVNCAHITGYVNAMRSELFWSTWLI